MVNYQKNPVLLRYSEQLMEHIKYAFNAFCKIVLRHEEINTWRDLKLQIKDSDTKQIVSDILKKLNALSEETCAKLTATPYTRDKAVIRKFDTLAADFTDTYRLTGQDKASKTYSFPKSHVSYCKPRAVGNEQREWATQMIIDNNKATGD